MQRADDPPGSNTAQRQFKARSAAGSMWPIMMVTGCLIIVPLVLFLTHILVSHCAKGEQQSAVDAAALAAAEAIGEIVENDPQFGYVAVTDAPPLGRATTAGDGSSLPVTGINTLLAATRLNALLAEKLDNETMRALAQRDAEACSSAAERLRLAINASCSATGKTGSIDRDGNSMSVFKRAQTAYLRNSGRSARGSTLKSLEVEIGWLNAPCSSGMAVIEPVAQSMTVKEQLVGGCYRADIDMPVGQTHFYFAPLSKQASLVDARRFKPSDGKHVCVVVQVSAEEEMELEVDRKTIVKSVACAQPAMRQNEAASGRMMVHLPHGLPEGMRSLSDVLQSSALRRSHAEVFTANGGDYPSQDSAALVADETARSMDNRVGALFSQGLFDWLRSTHGRARIDSILAMMQTDLSKSFALDNGASICFTLNEQGTVRAIAFKDNPLGEQIVLDGQLYAQSFDAISTARGTWSMKMRDQVCRLGTKSGGKHAGDLLADLVDISPSGQRQDAFVTFAGSDTEAGAPVLRVNESSTNWCASFFPTELKRKSYLVGGLAVELELSSPVLVTN